MFFTWGYSTNNLHEVHTDMCHLELGATILLLI